ncbi:(2Fe-2S)-binding protein [Sporanaerobium hydrogeniformans]|uniref:(2Fe-2S)-binding protein n=1 Tax=Sporanaerobium hydrogeniformans TaxID=3072179 RepID=A0AC61DGW7_9FIRM|nr:(2Fe-2S)-binding protein [Sporanaerobium hydrogeniformans]PHV72147.1 (2Fe-2S)-binding protein [Sporanaerobium hydrogeniformans]
MTAEEYIKDKLTKTCPCTQVTRLKIKEAIAGGADSLDKIKQATGAMTGCCKGRRCRGSIEEMLKDSKNE